MSKKQRKKILILVPLVVFVNLFGFGQTKKELKPTNNRDELITIISGKTRSYYSLDRKKPSTISLRGPGKLRVITRGRFVPGEAETITYRLLFRVDGGEQQFAEFKNVKRSKLAHYQNGSLGDPGLLEDFHIYLGRGFHSIELNLDNGSIPVAARYLFTSEKEEKRNWISFCPLQPSEPVDLITRETITHYYRFSLQNPLRAKVIGPTELRVFTRVENQYQMKGRVHYRIQVIENGEVINTYQLNSRRSQVTIYKKEKDLVPGKAREFIIHVPEGEHAYEIIPLDKDKKTMLGRFFLPEEDL